MRRILLILLIVVLLSATGFAVFLTLYRPAPPVGPVEIPVPTEKLAPQ